MADALTILVLDDDSVFVGVMQRALQRRGHQVLAACNSRDALELARQTPPSHAVVDLKIAQESGLDCIAPLLAINPGLRILILTGYASVATAVTAIKAGAFDYACKPLDANAILAKLGLEQDSPALAAAATETAAPTLSVKRLAWEHVQQVLQQHDGNISASARALGMHRRTLQRMLLKKPVRQ